MKTDNPDGCEGKFVNGLQSTFYRFYRNLPFGVTFSDFYNLLNLHIVLNSFLWLQFFQISDRPLFGINLSDFCVTDFKLIFCFRVNFSISYLWILNESACFDGT